MLHKQKSLKFRILSSLYFAIDQDCLRLLSDFAKTPLWFSWRSFFFKLKTNEFIRVNFIRTEKIYFQHVFVVPIFKQNKNHEFWLKLKLKKKKRFFILLVLLYWHHILILVLIDTSTPLTQMQFHASIPVVPLKYNLF